MNKLFASVLIAAALPLASLAQTNTASTAPPSTQSFVASVEDYFTAFNTNSQTFATNSPYEIWTGAAYQSGINLGAQIGIEGKPFSKYPGLELGSVTTLASTVGTLAQEEVDLGWSIVHYDVELTLGAGAIDTFTGQADAGFKGGVFAEVKKALTANTFAGTRIEGIFGSGSKADQPVVSLFAGFTF